jgi:hypothetical protein
MPYPFIKRFQKHVTIEIPKNRPITISNTGSGITIVNHPQKKRMQGYANISLTGSDVDFTNPSKTDIDEKIDAALSKLHIVNDKVKGNEEKNVRNMMSSRNKRGPSRTYFLNSPELDGQFDYLRSRLQNIHDIPIDKIHRRQVNKQFKQMGYKRGIGNDPVQQIGELTTDNPV